MNPAYETGELSHSLTKKKKKKILRRKKENTSQGVFSLLGLDQST